MKSFHALVLLVVLSAANLPLSAQTSLVSFGTITSSDSGGSDPAGRVVGDFNQDGHLDLLVTSRIAANANVNLFSGDGRGSFSLARQFMFFPAAAAAAGDFNGDGSLDVVLTQDVSSKVGYGDVICGSTVGIGIFLGPTMSNARCVASVARGIAVQSGDFDGDGRADIAVVSAARQGLVIYSQLDFTTYGIKTMSIAGGDVAATAMAPPVDLDRNGTLDLVVSHSSGVKTFLGNGDGSFRVGGAAGGINPTQAVSVGDLNGDGIPDIAAVEGTTGRLLVSLGLGDGTFSTQAIATIGSDLPDVVVADLDRDGQADIIVAHRGAGTVQIFFGDGTGTFVTNPPLALSAKPRFLAAHDWDEDGDVDLGIVDGGISGQRALVWMALQDGVGPADVTPPTVAFSAPAEGSVVRGGAALTVSAADNVGVTHVDLYADATLIAKTAGPLYTVNWDLASVPGGLVTLRASAFDAALNESTWATVQVTVESSDTVRPVVAVPDNATVTATYPDGAAFFFSASATDNVDGSIAVICNPITGSIFPLGSTTVNCTATDTAGNTGSASFTVTVKATPNARVTVDKTDVGTAATVTAIVADGPARPGDWVALYAAGGSTYLTWKYLNGSQSAPASGFVDAAVPFTMPATPGTYEVRFFTESTLLSASAPITVVGATLTVDTTAARVAAPVTLRVGHGAGNATDWVGLYAAGGGALLNWQYLNGTQAAPATGVTDATMTITMPMTPGSYVLRFFVGAIVVATSPILTVASVTLTVSTTTAAPQGIVTATLADGPGNVGDWLGLYAVGGTNYLTWTYLNGGHTVPASGLTAATVSVTMPTTPGEYSLRFYAVGMLLATSPVITVPQPVPVTFTVSSTAVTTLGTVTATIAGGPGSTGDWVGLYTFGGSPLLDWWYLNGSKTLPDTGLMAATVAFTMPPNPGSYLLKFSTGATLLATSPPIAVAAATLTVGATMLAPLSTAMATVANGPGNVGDWVGLYGVGGTNYLDWVYLNGTKTRPATGLTRAIVAFDMPTTPGSYILRFYSAQTLLATSTTIVVASP